MYLFDWYGIMKWFGGIKWSGFARVMSGDGLNSRIEVSS